MAETQPKELTLKDYIGQYDLLGNADKDLQRNPWDGDLRSNLGAKLRKDEKYFWNTTADSVSREIQNDRTLVQNVILGQVDDNLEDILATGTEGFDFQKTTGLLVYMAQNSLPDVRDPENKSRYEILHEQIYQATKVLEARKDNPEEAKEIMRETLRQIHGNSIDRMAVNQPHFVEGLYASFVETATEQFVSEFMYKAKGKEGTYKMAEVSNYLKRTIKGSDAETKIDLVKGLV
ncbi:hypothetical protein HOG16_01880 [Candidatus Woesearchaeota archaeon]|jgi:hypothetical protein|nr:hypothetical protein [Candidatus Woesearchaeota archaeon]MBT4321681.1 hypothetical protein [Candidatus Woesearchaeota archaeon]MBT4631008.1 hypothetical protein [Candidatus Woesearchaeota archaeon]